MYFLYNNRYVYRKLYVSVHVNIEQKDGKEMKIEYVRVSTNDQNLDLQIDALKAYECDKIFQDKLSGVKDNRPGLEEADEFW